MTHGNSIQQTEPWSQTKTGVVDPHPNVFTLGANGSVVCAEGFESAELDQKPPHHLQKCGQHGCR